MSSKVKKIILIVLSVILLAAIGVGAYFIARDVIDSRSEGSTEIQQPEQPVDPAPPDDPETPTQPSEPEKPSISVDSSLKVTKDWVEIADTSWYNADLSSYEIGTVEELAGLVQLSQEFVTFANKEINLTSDISLQGLYEDDFEVSSLRTFSGTFNGNDHTISGFSERYALFDTINGGTIKNLSFNIDQSSASLVRTVQSNTATFENINVSGTFNASPAALGGIVSFLDFYASAVFDNCNVDISLTLDGQSGWYGGLVGIIQSFSKSVTISNCDVSMSVNGEIVRSVGGLFGKTLYVPVTVTNSSVNFENSSIIWDNANYVYSSAFEAVSGVGYIQGTTAEASSIDCDVTGEVTISVSIDSAGKFYEITNAGDTTNSTSSLTVIVSSESIDRTCPWGEYIGGYYGDVLAGKLTHSATGFEYNTEAYIVLKNGGFLKTYAYYDAEKDTLTYLYSDTLESGAVQVVDYANGEFTLDVMDYVYYVSIENGILNAYDSTDIDETDYILCQNLIKVVV